jgi:hypothetical protein
VPGFPTVSVRAVGIGAAGDVQHDDGVVFDEVSDPVTGAAARRMLTLVTSTKRLTHSVRICQQRPENKLQSGRRRASGQTSGRSGQLPFGARSQV